jgi:hypothetical protein
LGRAAAKPNYRTNELWYSPERDDFQTAIARLWWAISNKQDGLIEAEMCVELLLPDLSNSLLLDRYLEAAIIIHEGHKIQKLLN